MLEIIAQAAPVNIQFNNFKTERDKLPKDGKFKKNLLGLEMKYKFKKETTVQIKNNFVNSVDTIGNIKYHAYPTRFCRINYFALANSVPLTFFQSS